MAQFLFPGVLTLREVTFYVEAATEAEALALAQAGKWTDFDITEATPAKWVISESPEE